MQQHFGTEANKENQEPKRSLCFLCFLLLLAFRSQLETTAATLTVNSTSESGAGSLRQAIAETASGDTIQFSVTGTITLAEGELLITNNVSILGPGATSLAINGNHTNRVLEIVSNAAVTISGLTLRDGRASDGTNFSDAVAGNGGGLYNAGGLTLSNCVICGNSSGRGADNTVDGGNGGAGGGIYNIGTIALYACVVSSNFAGNGGAHYASASGGSGGSGGQGGGLYSLGQLTLTDCTLSGNSGGDGGGNTAGGPGGPGGDGGGLYNAGTAVITTCTISGNAAGRGGGGVFGPAPAGGDGGACAMSAVSP